MADVKLVGYDGNTCAGPLQSVAGVADSSIGPRCRKRLSANQANQAPAREKLGVVAVLMLRDGELLGNLYEN